MANILRQLILQRSVHINKLIDLYQKHEKDRTRPPLDKYFELLRSALDNFSKVIVIIDALDECTDAGIALLKEIRKQPKVCLLVTSRDIPIIEPELPGAYRLVIRASDEDIKKYLKERISSSSDLMAHTEKDPKLYDNIITTIVDKAQGM